jgi:anthranilate phosphoribosyltransferase
MFAQLIEKLTRHEDLTSEEAARAMTEVMEGRAAPARIAGLLVGLAMKGERPPEIVGLARTMRAHAVQLDARHDRVFDTCGTGGDRSGTFNISSSPEAAWPSRSTATARCRAGRAARTSSRPSG